MKMKEDKTCWIKFFRDKFQICFIFFLEFNCLCQQPKAVDQTPSSAVTIKLFADTRYKYVFCFIFQQNATCPVCRVQIKL